jgi:hypothetical protein
MCIAIKEIYPSAQIYVEYPDTYENKKRRIDIVLFIDGKMFPIELKFKTKEDTVKIYNRDINLRNHAAVDIGRYDYLKDIERIETFTNNKDFASGYSIMLTNDSKYYEAPREDTIDIEFNLSESCIKTGILKSKPGNKTFSNKPLVKLKGSYKMH